MTGQAPQFKIVYLLSFFSLYIHFHDSGNSQRRYSNEVTSGESIYSRYNEASNLKLHKLFESTMFQVKWWTNMCIKTSVKRLKSPTLSYSNSTSAFHPILKLIHDVELNPGLQSSLPKAQRNKKTKANITLVHLKRLLVKIAGKF